MMQSSQKIGGQTLPGEGLSASMQLFKGRQGVLKPRAIANLPHDVRALNRCLTSKPSPLCMISNHGFFGLIHFKNFDKASSNHSRRELHAWQRACSQWKHLLLYHALEKCVQRTGYFLPLQQSHIFQFLSWQFIKFK